MSQQEPDEAPAIAKPEADVRANRGGRKTVISTLLVVASIVAPLAVSSIWLRNQVTDTGRYVRTVKPLASNSHIQAAVAANVTTALFTRVDVAARAEQALPPRAQFLAVPLATGLRNYTETATKTFLASNAFQKLWVELNRRAHKQLVKILTGEGHYIQTKHGEVAIELEPVITRVKKRLHDRGITVFDRVPTTTTANSNFVIVSSKQLDNAQKAVRLLKTAAWVLPLIVLALYGIAVAISRTRRRTLLQASLALAASMAVLGIALTIGRSIYLDKVAGTALPNDAAAAFYDIVLHYLRLGLRVIAAIALLVAAGAFLSGPSRAAVAVRRRFGSALAWAQGETGVASTPVGRWVRAEKTALRVGAILLPIVLLLLWDTPTVALVIALVTLALFLLLVVEFLGRGPSGPPGEATLTP